MFSKRLLDLTTKPLSVFQSFMRTSQVQYKRSLSETLSEDSHQESSQSHQNSSNYNNNEEEDYHHDRTYSYQQSNYYNSGMFFTLPLFAIMTNKLNQVSCFFSSSSKHEPNKQTNRISLVQYESNNPIEDKWAVHQLETIPGYVTMVFDGHGGWQVADYASKHLPQEIEKALKANKSKVYQNEEAYIVASLNDAFDAVENGFLAVAREAYRLGFPHPGQVGACALVALVSGNKVYAANAGDCQGVILREENGKIVTRKINKKLNANSKKEQARLKKEFTDQDIYVCKKGNPKACYVKSRLQPTRAFGDFRLKHPDFNNPLNMTPEQGYRSKIADFKGPYITHVPEIRVLDLNKNDKFLVLSSDGMWDELKKEDVARIAERNMNDKEKLTSDLMNSAIAKAARDHNLSDSEIRNIPLGKRRNIHDDMTIIVVDLANQGR